MNLAFLTDVGRLLAAHERCKTALFKTLSPP
jgi:hypothetical protein